MKRAAFKAHPGTGGWIRTTIAPISDKHEARFGVLDAVMLFALIGLVVGIARALIAH
jgi:hypothetical protein